MSHQTWLPTQQQQPAGAVAELCTVRGTVQAKLLHQPLGACITNVLQMVRSCAAECPFGKAKVVSYYIRQIISQQVLGYPRCSSHRTQKGELHL